MDLREIPAAPFVRHPWEVARARFFCTLLGAAGLKTTTPRILDVGSGDAFLAHQLIAALPRESSIVCFDIHYTDRQLVELRAQEPRGLAFTREPPTGKFDVLLLLDVLEHVPSDVEFLQQAVTRHLEADASVLLSVPAWHSVYTRHDLALGHYRRYRPAALRRLAEAAGLRVVLQGGLFHTLLIVRALQKLGEVCLGVRARPAPEKFLHAADTATAHWTVSPSLSRALEYCLLAEGRLALMLARAGWALPGLSTWALCERT